MVYKICHSATVLPQFESKLWQHFYTRELTNCHSVTVIFIKIITGCVCDKNSTHTLVPELYQKCQKTMELWQLGYFSCVTACHSMLKNYGSKKQTMAMEGGNYDN